MSHYIFLGGEGYTFIPKSENPEPEVENLQVIGFSDGNDEIEAYTKLISENLYLIDSGFDEIICIELKVRIEDSMRFYISEKRGEK